jgi:sulfur-oxidizing protein SoxZ
MSKTSRTGITMPAQAKKGAIIEIRAIAQHDMETGYRYTEDGKRIPRDIIRLFTCQYNGEEVFRADFYPGIGANPLIIFRRKLPSRESVCFLPSCITAIAHSDWS